MDTDKMQLIINRFKEALKSFYEHYVKPVLDKLKSLFITYIYVPPRTKYEPMKSILPKMNIDFRKYRILHCRNNC
jgi:hypothetical protein